MGWPGVVLIMTLESTCVCVPIPSEAVMPLSGWMLIKDKGLDISYTLVAGFYGGLGGTLGSLIEYAVAAKMGRGLLLRFGKYIFVTPADIAAGDRWFEKHGEAAVFFSRLIPMVRTLISIPAGIVRMPLGKFIVYTFAGSFLWSWALAVGGYILGEHWEEMRSVMRPFDIPIIGASIILVGIYVYRHIKRRGQPTTIDT